MYGVGPLFHIAFTDVLVRNARDNLAEDKALRKRAWDGLLKHGVHISGGRGFVSLQHTAGTVDEMVERFDAALREV